MEVESNNFPLVSILKSGANCFFEMGWLVEDIREIVPSFRSIFFSSVSNHCNLVAHALAGFAKEKDGLSVWLEDSPFFLFPIVNKNSFP